MAPIQVIIWVFPYDNTFEYHVPKAADEAWWGLEGLAFSAKE